jgi:hypothetical protein
VVVVVVIICQPVLGCLFVVCLLLFAMARSEVTWQSQTVCCSAGANTDALPEQPHILEQ